VVGGEPRIVLSCSTVVDSRVTNVTWEKVGGGAGREELGGAAVLVEGTERRREVEEARERTRGEGGNENGSAGRARKSRRQRSRREGIESTSRY
jgi:hypothetical protein